MKCPGCRKDNDRVIDSRTTEDGFSIRRRRQCNDCDRRYTTYERIEERPVKVVKKDGTRTPFDRERLRRGMEKACWKRPVSDDQIEAVVLEIQNDIYANFETEVQSQYLGEAIMTHLRQIDHVAYVRFASVYREFQDARDFAEELDPLINESRPK